MAASTPELPHLAEFFVALKERRNFLIGAASAALLVLAVFWFVRVQAREARYAPWRAALAGGMPWELAPEELARRATEVAGTEAEPLLLYFEILRRYEAKDLAGAGQKAGEFRAKFADHYLARTPVVAYGRPAAPAAPLLQQFEQGAADLQAWNQAHPLPTANPAPSPEDRVTLVTERGSIVVSLYPEAAPESCRLLAQLAPHLKDQFVVNALPGQWLEIGHKADAGLVEVESGLEKFPPFEPNALLHFRGAVTFGQRPFSGAPHYPHLKVWLADSFRDDGATTVLGQVTEGIELLTKLADEAKDADVPTRLTAPLAIQDVQVATRSD